MGLKGRAEHSIILLTNMTELDSKDTINKKQSLGVEINLVFYGYITRTNMDSQRWQQLKITS